MWCGSGPTQEGKSDIDYLREEEFVNGLKISSADHMPATLYQVSIKVGGTLESGQSLWGFGALRLRLGVTLLSLHCLQAGMRPSELQSKASTSRCAVVPWLAQA
jgi:hypothetical protein